MIEREIKVGDRLRHNASYGEIVVGEIVGDDGEALRDVHGKLWIGPFVQAENWSHVDDLQADNVNHPPHYKQGDIECIDAIRAALGREGFISYCRGNAIKYLWRCEHKGGTEDMHKAEWYVNRANQEQSE